MSFAWSDERGSNLLDSGSHFYEVYETADGKYISLGAIEPQFYAALLEKLGADAVHFENQFDMPNWPAMKERMAEQRRSVSIPRKFYASSGSARMISTSADN